MCVCVSYDWQYMDDSPTALTDSSCSWELVLHVKYNWLYTHDVVAFPSSQDKHTRVHGHHSKINDMNE
jgi:hypothetical protein